MMKLYHLHGGHLAAELSFPELALAEAGDPDWTLEIASGAPELPEGELLGSDLAEVGVHVRAYRTASGFRLRYDDTGVFDITERGSRIRWYPSGSPREDLVRADVLGRVLAVALHAGRRFTLHGSAVATELGAIAFVAPKQSGKSTLALALAKEGADLMADDMVPVDLGPPALAFPGVQSVRLFRDSARYLGMSSLEASLTDGDKGVEHEPAVRRRTIIAPLRAIYVLEPADPVAAAVRRESLDPAAAAMALVAHAKVGALLGRTEAPVLLGQATALARVVPVQRLSVARDFDRLPIVVDTILGWHSARRITPRQAELAAW